MPRLAGLWDVDLRDLVLPRTCPICLEPTDPAAGRAPWCRPCAQLVEPALSGPARWVTPSPKPAGFPPCAVGARGRRAVRTLVRRWKDEARADLSPVLGQALAGALLLAVDDLAEEARWRERPVLLIPVPSRGRARRRRGAWPVRDLLTAVARTGSLPAWVQPTEALTLARRVVDQRSLTASGRIANLRGSMALTRDGSRLVPGALCVIVDDLVTSGATLIEAARVLHGAGAPTVRAATCASTEKRGFSG